MKNRVKWLSLLLSLSLVITVLGFLPANTASAATLLTSSYDFDGDGKNDILYDNGGGNFSVVGTKKNASWYVGSYNVVIWEHDLNQYAGNEIVVTGWNNWMTILSMSSSTYNVNIGSWAGVSYADIDGVAGKEAIVSYANGDIFIVNYQTRSTSTYKPGGWLAFSPSDVDGATGAELVFSFYGGVIKVLHPVNGSYRTYSPGWWGKLDLVDLDGYAGNEIVLSEFYGLDIKVITDRTGGTTTYANTWSGGYDSIEYKDTDGYPGNEMILSLTPEYSTRFEIIHHRGGARLNYNIPGGWTSKSYYNQDGVVGNEIVFTYSGTSQKKVIHDRSRTVYTIN